MIVGGKSHNLTTNGLYQNHLFTPDKSERFTFPEVFRRSNSMWNNTAFSWGVVKSSPWVWIWKYILSGVQGCSSTDLEFSYFYTQNFKLSELEIGRGDNLQLFISPLLKYEEWLYNVTDDKNFEINSLEPPCTGVLKILHTLIGTCRNAKNENSKFCFDCGKNVFQWTRKKHLGHFD